MGWDQSFAFNKAPGKARDGDEAGTQWILNKWIFPPHRNPPTTRNKSSSAAFSQRGAILSPLHYAFSPTPHSLPLSTPSPLRPHADASSLPPITPIPVLPMCWARLATLQWFRPCDQKPGRPRFKSQPFYLLSAWVTWGKSLNSVFLFVIVPTSQVVTD